MASYNWDYVGRKPRHPVADAELIVVRFGRPGGKLDERLDAELVDFARNGARLRFVDSPAADWLREGEAIVLHMRSLNPGVDIGLPGTVRWRRAEGPSLWLIGCEFDHETSLETLGELFLNEILSDGRSPAQREAVASEAAAPEAVAVEPRTRQD